MRALFAVILLFAATSVSANTTPDERTRSATTVLKEMSAIPENSIPERLLAEAYAIAVVPKLTKAALGIGGRGGKGLISVRGADGVWSNPNYINVGGGSLGFQAGVQKSDLILVFTSKDGVDGIIKGKFTLGADAAVAAGPVGRNVQASTDENLKAEIYSYSRSKGLFAGVALDGTVIRIDRKSNEVVYGDMASPASIFDGRTQTQNPAIIDFRNQLEEGSSRQAKK
ncbi:lipid-binding SYLF domain-containing protein [Arenimonas sp.]|jgi:lipid-binding SYLF domain-containing protein|uniref:lipid-binding SYLF domain-containing protein n=1 Tax=Arenimonas sp. TaxID=1872635 RepID=UPI0037C11716